MHHFPQDNHTNVEHEQNLVNLELNNIVVMIIIIIIVVLEQKCFNVFPFNVKKLPYFSQIRCWMLPNR